MECRATEILLVEDDPIARRFLAENLSADGFAVSEAGSVAGALAVLRSRSPALAVIDLGLPDGDGLELIRDVRAYELPAARVDRDLPLIVLSGRAGEADRLRGLNSGADDYVVKPFSVVELTARIRAVLRRRSLPAAPIRLRLGPLEIDAVSREVSLYGEPVTLSPTEFRLLRTLAREPSRVFTRQELLQTVWGYKSHAPSRTVDAHAWRLRQKLSGGPARYVINLWGVGYRLCEGAVPQTTTGAP
jgi:DNA-binding response OmpR family regulator